MALSTAALGCVQAGRVEARGRSVPRTGPTNNDTHVLGCVSRAGAGAAADVVAAADEVVGPVAPVGAVAPETEGLSAVPGAARGVVAAAAVAAGRPDVVPVVVGLLGPGSSAFGAVVGPVPEIPGPSVAAGPAYAAELGVAALDVEVLASLGAAIAPGAEVVAQVTAL